jgi:hypothetical protein
LVFISGASSKKTLQAATIHRRCNF